MFRFNGNHIENYDAWLRGKQARIFANANKTRRDKMVATLAGEPGLKAWLLNEIPAELEALRQTSQAEWSDAIDSGNTQLSDKDGPAHQAYVRAWREWERTRPVLPTWLAEALDRWGGLTDKQLAVARRIFNEHAVRVAKRVADDEARRATAAPWTAGRQEITGTIQSVKWQEQQDGLRGALKGLILVEDGRKLWTTIPSSLQTGRDAELKGTTVTMRVTITPSRDDPTFAFGKRPTV